MKIKINMNQWVADIIKQAHTPPDNIEAFYEALEKYNSE
jgi:hypothetical protein